MEISLLSNPLGNAQPGDIFRVWAEGFRQHARVVEASEDLEAFSVHVWETVMDIHRRTGSMDIKALKI